MKKLIDEQILNNAGIEITKVGNDSQAPYFGITTSAEDGGIKLMPYVDDVETAISPLSIKEAALLKECEETIKSHLPGYIKTAIALSTIQSKKLYRQQYSTFEAYLEEKFDISRAHGYRLIAVAKAAEDLSHLGDISKLSANSLQQYNQLGVEDKDRIKDSIEQKLADEETDTITTEMLTKAINAVAPKQVAPKQVAPKQVAAKKKTADFAELLRITEQALNLHRDPEHKDDVEGLLLQLKLALCKLVGKNA